MKITFQQKPTDPTYPIMEGKFPLAKEFNKRMEKLWKSGITIMPFEIKELVTNVLFDIFSDDYNKRYTPLKK